MYLRKDGIWAAAITLDGKRRTFYGRRRGEAVSKMMRALSTPSSDSAAPEAPAPGSMGSTYVSRAAAIAATNAGDIDVARIAERDRWICAYCGQPVFSDLKWPHPRSKSLDHLVPLVQGGKHSEENMVLAHLLCNMRKGYRDDVGLPAPPVRPRYKKERVAPAPVVPLPSISEIDPATLLDAEDVAVSLGMDPESVSRMMGRGIIPSLMLNGERRVTEEVLHAWVRAQEDMTMTTEADCTVKSTAIAPVTPDQTRNGEARYDG